MKTLNTKTVNIRFIQNGNTGKNTFKSITFKYKTPNMITSITRNVKTDIILDTINRANGLLTVESMTLNNKTTDTENELLNGMLKDKYIISYNDIDGSNWQPKMYTDKKGIPQLDWILN